MKKFSKYIFTLLIITILNFFYHNYAFSEEEDIFVNVYLKRLNIDKTIKITFTDDYIAKFKDGEMLIKKESKLNIIYINNNIYIDNETSRMHIGKELNLFSLNSNDNSGMKIQDNTNIYNGNLKIIIKNEKLFPILNISLEKYLLGVVPYEMSDSFPIEALKAQSILARTYVLYRKNSKSEYDVTDTTSDQVYKGYNESNKKAIEAIKTTKSLVMSIDNNIFDTYYSASNGGQTELPENKWNKKINGYVMKDDKYDYENKDSLVKTVIINKQYPLNESKLLIDTLKKRLTTYATKNGFSDNIENIRIDNINKITLHGKLYPSPSKIFSKISFSINFSGKTKLSESEIKNKTLPDPTPTPFIYNFIQATDQEQEYYSDFMPYEKEVTLTLSLHDEFLKEANLSLKGGGKEIVEISENKNSYTLKIRRYGHGIGMSQRGAQSMANHGYTDKDILNFYFTGFTIKNYKNLINYTANKNLVYDKNLIEKMSNEIKIDYTKNIIPILWNIPDGIKTIIVNKISKDSYLNLRESPSTDSAVIKKLYYGQELVVDESTSNEEWLHVFINKNNPNEYYEGYVLKEFIDFK